MKEYGVKPFLGNGVFVYWSNGEWEKRKKNGN
jgi:hypothetical protein